VLLATLPRVLPGAFRPWSAPVWLVTVAGLAMTYTRGAWLGLGAGAVALLPMSRRGRLALLAILVLLPLVFLLGPRELSHRFRSMSDPDEAGIKERVYMWRSGVTMWRERPLLGWGPGGVKREYSRYALPEAFKQRTGHVHNTPLQILVERGLPGLAAWLAIYRDTARHWDLYELAEELVDLEDWFQQWRFRHVTTVERIIGRKRGTGGTSGVGYLRQALDIRFFPELWEVRTELRSRQPFFARTRPAIAATTSWAERTAPSCQPVR